MRELENLFIDLRGIRNKSAALFSNLQVNIARQDQLTEHVNCGMWDKELVSRHFQAMMDKYLILHLMPQAPS